MNSDQVAAQEEKQGMTETVRKQGAGRRHLLGNAFTFLVIVSSLLLSASIMPLWQLLIATPANPLHPMPNIVGRFSFASSGEPFDPASERGLDDVVTITLHALAPPTQGARYDAWLLPDPSDVERPSLFLGNLSLSGGRNAALTYTDPQHSNLLATYSQFLITEGDRAALPLGPALDAATWRYQGGIPTMPTPGESHLSFLDYLRLLLGQDPTLSAAGLSGGLGTWLLRKEVDVLAYAIDARNTAEAGGEQVRLRDQVIGILDSLDGAMSIQRDVPPGTPWLLDPRIGGIGLLAFPPLIEDHLIGLSKAPGATADQSQLALALVQALTRIASFLQNIRNDALVLMGMSDAQLSGELALPLLDEMVTGALYAYDGPMSAVGSAQGVAWIYQQIQSLAAATVQVVAHV